MATPQVESKDDQVVISLAQLKQFTVSVMTKAGARPAHAETLADVIIGADRRGHYSHGMNRLGQAISTYINTKICLFVCLLFVHVFLGHFETDWITLLHKVFLDPE